MDYRGRNKSDEFVVRETERREMSDQRERKRKREMSDEFVEKESER